jgi:hypothetical protein
MMTLWAEEFKRNTINIQIRQPVLLLHHFVKAPPAVISREMKKDSD